MKYDVAVLTDVGLVRTNNEDAYLIDKDLDLFILADGMGGYQKGEVASLMTCQGIAEYFRTLFKSRITDFTQDHCKKAVNKANTDIRNKIKDIVGLDKMGSTVVALLLKKDIVYVLNVGDSRAYLFHHNQLEQISIDHSLIQESKNAGIKKELAMQFKNIVTRAVGMKDVVDADVFPLAAKAGDLFLLCSDGLHGFVSDENILKILQSGENLETKVKKLIDEAKAGGGKDNITAILVSILEDQHPQESVTQTLSFCSNKNASKTGLFSSLYIRILLGLIIFIVLVTIGLILI